MMLSSLAPHAWATAGPRNPSPTELTPKLCLVTNVNLPEFVDKTVAQPPSAAVVAAVRLRV